MLLQELKLLQQLFFARIAEPQKRCVRRGCVGR